MAAALHAIWFSDIQPMMECGSTAGLSTNGGQVLKYFLSETIHNGSRGTHFAKFLISNFLQGLTYSAMTYDIDHDLSKEE